MPAMTAARSQLDLISAGNNAQRTTIESAGKTATISL
jgi:hypothetical protein